MLHGGTASTGFRQLSCQACPAVSAIRHLPMQISCHMSPPIFAESPDCYQERSVSGCHAVSPDSGNPDRLFKGTAIGEEDSPIQGWILFPPLTFLLLINPFTPEQMFDILIIQTNVLSSRKRVFYSKVF